MNYTIRPEISIPDKQQQEAKDHNLILLSKTDNRCYGFYKMACGHSKFLHYGAIRKAKTNDFKCKECLDIKLQEEANKFNLTYNKDLSTERSDSRSYTFNACGHRAIIKTANIRFSAVSCAVCRNNQYVSEAKAAGLIYLGDCGKDAYRKYQMPCGHIKDICMTNVRDGTWKCKVCQEERYAKEADARGIFMHMEEKSSHYDYRVYTLKCGCKKELAIACVRKGSFECKNHSTRFIYNTCPISVYLVKFTINNNFVLKVGFSRDVNLRLARYGLNGVAELLIEKVFDNGQEAVDFERNFHERYKNYSLPSDEMRMYMENGFTECYPITLLDKITKELEEAGINCVN